ncbi:MAG: phenylalanine--tRNA ligase subunit beta [Pirellulaceae bacterium]
MIVSWNWLKEYVDLKVDPAEVERRLMMAGLNHEGTVSVGDDLAIDLEVTSNRPDCLGHIGVAREAAVLFDVPMQVPAADPPRRGKPVDPRAKVRIDCPDLCYRYTARVIRGAKIGPSPDWLAERLRSVGLAAINNVVDISNYVLMECGQPLHAFDFDKIGGREIIVREARSGETFVAIDHREYNLEPGMCVIADAHRAVALGGVMGGAETEVSESTRELLIESAEFAPVSIRTTARRLSLHSPSSYRFERGVDPLGVDWASRRCCELILDLAGGELAEGVVDVGREIPERDPVILRLSQIPRVLGVDVSGEEVQRILAALGNEVVRADPGAVEVIPPSWRRDLTREIDLVEEVARIHGYEQIPEDVAVPMCPSHLSDRERVLDKVRTVLTAAGFDEAMTCTLVPPEWSQTFSPWSDADPILSRPQMKGILADAPKDLSPADTIRRSLIPSLLDSRRYNESLSNPVVELFETANVYLARGDDLPREQWTVSLVSGRNFTEVKGVIEQLVAATHSGEELATEDYQHPLFSSDKSCKVRLGDNLLGFLGEVSPAAGKQLGLRSSTLCMELNLETLAETANLIPQYRRQSPYPSIARDLNLIVDEGVRWARLVATVQAVAGNDLENVTYQETYRDAKKDGGGKKRMLFSISIRSSERTFTSEEADGIRDRIVAACAEQYGAKLLG